MTPIEKIITGAALFALVWFGFEALMIWIHMNTSVHDKQVSEEFEEKARNTFHEVKKRHPELKDVNITFQVSEYCTFVPPGYKHQVWGAHRALTINENNSHKIEIAEAPHNSDAKLYDTICHELAHALDVEKRGESDHSDIFEARKDEIEEHAPMEIVM